MPLKRVTATETVGSWHECGIGLPENIGGLNFFLKEYSPLMWDLLVHYSLKIYSIGKYSLTCKGNMSSYEKIKFYEFIIRYFIKK